MIVSMREGIRPLCDKHKAPMVLEGFADRGLAFRAFACNEFSCTRRYNQANGYFDVVGGRILLEKTRRPCPDDETPMFLEMVNEDKTELWRCAQINCDQMRPPLRADLPGPEGGHGPSKPHG